MTTLKRICLIAMVLVPMLGTLTIRALPAQAVVYDAGAINKLKDRRNVLKAKEYGLLLDYEEIRKQIDDLQRRNDPLLDRKLDDLHRDLNVKYADLEQVRMDLRDVEVKMM